MAPSSSIRFERKEKATCYGKGQVRQIQAFNSGACHCECRNLEASGTQGLNASSRGVTPRCEELSVKFAEAGLHVVMLRETQLQVKEIANTSKYDFHRSFAKRLDGTHVLLDKDASFRGSAQKAHGCYSDDLWRLLAFFCLGMLWLRTVRVEANVNFVNNSKKSSVQLSGTKSRSCWALMRMNWWVAL